MVNCYRRFIRNAAAIQAPLNVYLKWYGYETENAFQSYKDSLTNAALLAHPKFNTFLLLTTDASNVACGAALQQKVNEIW